MHDLRRHFLNANQLFQRVEPRNRFVVETVFSLITCRVNNPSLPYASCLCAGAASFGRAHIQNLQSLRQLNFKRFHTSSL